MHPAQHSFSPCLACAFAFALASTCLIGCDGCSPTEPLAQEGDGCTSREDEAARFTCRVAPLVHASLPEATVSEAGPLSFDIVFEDGQRMRANLDNLWAECGARPDTCESNAQRWVSGISESIAAWNAAVDPARVRAVLKPDAWFAALEAESRAMPAPDGTSPRPELPTTPFQPGVRVAYVEDRSDSMRVLTSDDLADLQLDVPSLHALALANLRAACADFGFAPVEDGSRVMTLRAGDSYEASRLLLLDAWAPIAQQVEGQLLVAAPSRDHVLFTGDARADDVAALRRLAQAHAASDGHGIDPMLLRWSAGGWTPVSDL
ncbi:MAG: DUF1444 family protein [Polyangiales bacterium]|nr:DUF1444 family protein [Myxococcales bacterium]